MVSQIESTGNRIKVAVLLKHYKGEENWSAHVPALEDLEHPQYVPLAEGPTPEEAAQAIIPVMEEGIQEYPELVETLLRAPQYAISQVEITQQT